MSQANTTNVEWQWSVRRVKINKVDGDLTNVVKAATWTLEAEYIAEDGDQFLRGYADTTEFTDPDSDAFIQFEEVDANTVVTWIESAEADRMDAIKQKIITKLNNEMGNEVETQLMI